MELRVGRDFVHCGVSGDGNDHGSCLCTIGMQLQTCKSRRLPHTYLSIIDSGKQTLWSVGHISVFQLDKSTHIGHGTGLVRGLACGEEMQLGESPKTLKERPVGPHYPLVQRGHLAPVLPLLGLFSISVHTSPLVISISLLLHIEKERMIH